MTSVETFVCPTPEATAAQQARGIEKPLQQALTSVALTAGEVASVASLKEKVASWKADTLSAKQMFGLTNLLESKVDVADAVMLDNYVQPVDRGPAVGTAAAAADLLRSWQYQVTGKLATAQVLSELGAVHVKSGGSQGIQAEACKHIAAEQLDNTFYIVDLGNVMRMFKAGIA